MVLCRGCDCQALTDTPVDPGRCLECERTVYPLQGETLCEPCAGRLAVCESCRSPVGVAVRLHSWLQKGVQRVSDSGLRLPWR